MFKEISKWPNHLDCAIAVNTHIQTSFDIFYFLAKEQLRLGEVVILNVHYMLYSKHYSKQIGFLLAFYFASIFSVFKAHKFRMVVFSLGNL